MAKVQKAPLIASELGAQMMYEEASTSLVNVHAMRIVLSDSVQTLEQIVVFCNDDDLGENVTRIWVKELIASLGKSWGRLGAADFLIIKCSFTENEGGMYFK